VVDATAQRSRGSGRILYWFRTPPGIRVGRAALDDETRRLLERQHPDIAFDWRHLLADIAPTGSLAPRPRTGPPPGAEDAGVRRRRERAPAARHAMPAAPYDPPQADPAVDRSPADNPESEE